MTKEDLEAIRLIIREELKCTREWPWETESRDKHKFETARLERIAEEDDWWEKAKHDFDEIF